MGLAFGLKKGEGNGEGGPPPLAWLHSTFLLNPRNRRSCNQGVSTPMSKGMGREKILYIPLLDQTGRWQPIPNHYEVTYRRSLEQFSIMPKLLSWPYSLINNSSFGKVNTIKRISGWIMSLKEPDFYFFFAIEIGLIFLSS